MNPEKRRDGLALMARIAQTQAAERGVFVLWTVYDHPTDHPHGHIARMFTVAPGEQPQPTAKTIAGTLAELRAILDRAGLIKWRREDGDDPKIVESWI